MSLPFSTSAIALVTTLERSAGLQRRFVPTAGLSGFVLLVKEFLSSCDFLLSFCAGISQQHSCDHLHDATTSSMCRGDISMHIVWKFLQTGKKNVCNKGNSEPL